MNKKKAQVGQVQNIVLVLLLVSVILVAGFFILQEFSELDDLKTSQSVDNETGGFINSTGYTLSAESGSQTDSFTVTEARNASDGSVIDAGNYTVDSTTGEVTNATAQTFPDVNFDYTYQEGQQSWVGVNETLDAMLTIPALLGLVVLIAMVAIVLTLVLNALPRGQAGA